MQENLVSKCKVRSDLGLDDSATFFFLSLSGKYVDFSFYVSVIEENFWHYHCFHYLLFIFLYHRFKLPCTAWQMTLDKND